MARGSLKDRLFSVYCHISPSGKRYVGISCDPQNRWGLNGCNYRKNYRFYRAIQKYGWDAIKHTILFNNLNIEQAKEIEIDLIDRWHLTDFKYGYNLRDGGDGTFSLESRKKMSKSRMGNKNSAGRVFSDEVKAKISEGLKRYYAEHPQKKKRQVYKVYKEDEAPKRKKHSDVSKEKNPSARPILQFDIDGKFIASYPYAKQAAQKYGYDLSTLIKCCKGKAKTAYGYKWRYGETQLCLF